MNVLELLEELVKQMNTHSKEKVQKFIMKNYNPKKLGKHSPDPLIDFLLQVSEKEDIIPYSKKSEGNYAEIIFQNQQSTLWTKFGITATETNPPKIKSVSFFPTETPQNKRQQRLTDEEIKEALPQLLNDLMTTDEFSGTVLLSKDDEIIFSNAYGYANRAFKIPNNLETKINLGSINKMFTGVAVAKLVEEGQLCFEDTVTQRLPNVSIPKANEITISQLLSHTSGLGNYFTPEFCLESEKYAKVSDITSFISTQKLKFEPGSTMHYSNSGFVIAGAIIEEVSGMSYFDYVMKNIYEVAEMANTDCYRVDSLTPNLATGYTKRVPKGSLDKWRTNTRMISVQGSPAGGGYSTVIDLLKFSQAFRENKILDEKFRKIVTSNQINVSDKNIERQYGYGFSIQNSQEETIIGHFGGAQGINAAFSMYEESKYTVIVLANQDPSAAEIVALRIKSMLLG